MSLFFCCDDFFCHALAGIEGTLEVIVPVLVAIRMLGFL